MRRRTFIAALSCLSCFASTRPMSGRAADGLARVGYLGPASGEDQTAMFGAFKAGLAELGYVAGRTIVVEARFANGHEDQMAKLAMELVDLKVDVIVTSGAGVYAAHKVTNTVPIVSAIVGDLVAVGLAESLSHPGGNVTGETIFFLELMAKRIAFLKQIKPDLSSVGVLFPQGYSAAPAYVRGLTAPARALGVELRQIEIAEPSDCESALSSEVGASIGGLATPEFPQFDDVPGSRVIVSAAQHRGLPVAGSLTIARSGGILGFGVERLPMLRRAAFFVDKILRGTKPGDLPIERAMKFQTIVNLKSARTIGLEMPATLLASADEVIE